MYQTLYQFRKEAHETIQSKQPIQFIQTKQSYPYNCIGVIQHKFYSENQSRICNGTGFLVSDRLVLTCAHNIYFRQQIKAQITFSLCNERQYAVKKIFNPREFQTEYNRQPSKHDYALLELDRPVNIKRYFVLAFDYDASQLVEVPGFYRTFHEQKQKFCMRSDTNLITKIENGLIFHTAHTQRGQSGSPIFIELAKNTYFVIGIHTHGRGIREDNCNVGVRFTKETINMIKKWEKIISGKNQIKAVSCSQIKQEIYYQPSDIIFHKNSIKEVRRPHIKQPEKYSFHIVWEPNIYQNCIGIVRSKFKSDVMQGSGFLISNKLVLTCANNVFDFQTNQNAKQIVFIHIEHNLTATYKIKVKFAVHHKSNLALLKLKSSISLKKYYNLAFNCRKDQSAAITMLNPTIKDALINTWEILIAQNKYSNLNLFNQFLNGSPIILNQSNNQQMIVGIIRKNQYEFNELCIFTSETEQIIHQMQLKIGQPKTYFLDGSDLQSSMFCKQMRTRVISANQNQINEAVSCFKFVRQFEKNGFLKNLNQKVAEMYYKLGKAYNAMHRLSEAAQSIKRSYFLLHKLKFYHINLKGLILYEFGVVEKKLEHYDNALKLLQDAIKIFTFNSEYNKLMIAKACIHLGKIHRLQCEYTEAMQNYKKAHQIQRNEFGESNIKGTQTLFELAECSTWFYQLEDALKYVEQCLESLEDRTTKEEDALYKRCKSLIDLLIKIHLKLDQLTKDEIQQTIDAETIKERKQTLREYVPSKQRYTELVRLAKTYLPNHPQLPDLIEKIK